MRPGATLYQLNKTAAGMQTVHQHNIAGF